MATYAIGDIQGCFFALQALLTKINFDPQRDTLWFTGDLVNRGTQSLEVLRFIKNLGDQHITVLGNHDLHLLAVVLGKAALSREDTFHDVLEATDCDVLMDWLRYRPLLHDDKDLGFVMAHAGLAPVWGLKKAQILAREVEAVLQSDNPRFFLEHLYGNQPNYWDEDLSGVARWRAIVNYFTRMRFCDAKGHLDLSYKGEIGDHPQKLVPWFSLSSRVNRDLKIIFGHWAALRGETGLSNLYPLDTGCVWGHCLTAMCLEDEKRYSVGC